MIFRSFPQRRSDFQPQIKEFGKMPSIMRSKKPRWWRYGGRKPADYPVREPHEMNVLDNCKLPEFMRMNNFPWFRVVDIRGFIISVLIK